MKSVIAVVPAFNEAGRIGKVLRVLSHAVEKGILTKVIVVNDASTDSTAEEARKFLGTEVVEMSKNRGKGGALFAGIELALREKPNYILEMDADLQGLNIRHIEALLERGKSADMTIGMRDYIPSKIKPLQWLRNHTGGERVFNAGVLRGIMSRPEFVHFAGHRHGLGIDLALSVLYSRMGKSIAFQSMTGVRHTSKKIKVGPIRGRWKNIRMNAQFLQSFIQTHAVANRMKRALRRNKIQRRIH